MTSRSTRAPMARDYIYVVAPGGHRQAYVDQLGPMFGLEPHVAPMNLACFRWLLKADRLLLATIDDHVLSFAALAVLRRLAGRKTVGLFLRFNATTAGTDATARVKRVLFNGLRRLDGVGIVAILPFSIDPRFAAVATDGVCDPQLWDMHDGSKLRPPVENKLSHLLSRHAHGRWIVVLPGSLTRIKGFGLMADALETTPDLNRRYLFVAAGEVSDDCHDAADRFTAAGGLLVNRRISDDELEGLYAASDLIWCCYTPDYDQASGIFGRAIQFGKTPIVRRGSLIEKLARELRVQALSAETANLDAFGARLVEHCDKIGADLPPPMCPDHQDRIGDLRRAFIEIIGKRLIGRTPNPVSQLATNRSSPSALARSLGWHVKTPQARVAPKE